MPSAAFRGSTAKTGQSNPGSRLVLAIAFVVMHAVVGLAGATCCLDRVLARYDYCIDKAEYDAIVEAQECGITDDACRQEALDRLNERKAACRRIRDQEMNECNI